MIIIREQTFPIMAQEGARLIKQLLALHREAEREGIYTAYCPLKDNSPAMVAKVGDIVGIALNTRYIETVADEKYALAHELGHYYTGTYYDEKTSLLDRAKMEYWADASMVRRIVPLWRLKKAVREGYREAWELADYFNLPEHVITRAFYIYKCKDLL